MTTPSKRWTDGERIKLASRLLSNALLLERESTDSQAKLLETIDAANAVLTLPGQELEAVESQVATYADKICGL